VKRLAEKDKEDCASPVEKDRQGKVRESGKKVKLSMVSTSSSEVHSHHQLPTPTCSSHSRPLVQTSPLTPPQSEKSISTMLSSVSESTGSTSSHDNDRNLHDARKRSPSDPILRVNGAFKGRSRSVTAGANKDTNSPTRSRHYGKNSDSTATATVSTGPKLGRGRGRGGAGTGTGRKSATGDGNGGPTAHGGAGRGRGGRGLPTTSTSSGPARGRRPSAH